MWFYFNTVCKIYNLGELLDLIEINGGKTNSMYKITTTKGVYAIKILSQSNIKGNRQHLVNIEVSEHISNQAKNNGVNAISAIKYNGTYIQKVNDLYILIYEWYSGKMPYEHELTPYDIKNIAHQLALLHKVPTFSSLKPRTNQKIEFQNFFELLSNNNEEWSSYILKYFDELIMCYDKSWDSYKKLSSQSAFIHGDLNSKNMLIDGDTVRFLDWETAKIGNPSLDFFYTSFFGIGDYNPENYYYFAKEYLSSNSLLDDPTIASYATLTEEFSWLELCLKRGLSIQTSNLKEINTGKDSATRSLDRILKCYNQMPEFLQIINRVNKEHSIKKETDLDER